MQISAPQISRPPGKCKTLKFLYYRINKEKPQISPANNKFKGPQILTSLDLIFPFEMEAKLYAIACESYHSWSQTLKFLQPYVNRAPPPQILLPK